MLDGERAHRVGIPSLRGHRPTIQGDRFSLGVGDHSISRLDSREHFGKGRIRRTQFERPPATDATGRCRDDQSDERSVAKPPDCLERNAGYLMPILDQKLEFRIEPGPQRGESARLDANTWRKKKRTSENGPLASDGYRRDLGHRSLAETRSGKASSRIETGWPGMTDAATWDSLILALTYIRVGVNAAGRSAVTGKRSCPSRIRSLDRSPAIDTMGIGDDPTTRCPHRAVRDHRFDPPRGASPSSWKR